MDVIDVGRYFGALLITLALLGGAALAFRALKPRLAGFAAANTPIGRASLVQSLPLDARRRLVVTRFDGRDHLILLGINGETLISTTEAARLPANDVETAA